MNSGVRLHLGNLTNYVILWELFWVVRFYTHAPHSKATVQHSKNCKSLIVLTLQPTQIETSLFNLCLCTSPGWWLSYSRSGFGLNMSGCISGAVIIDKLSNFSKFCLLSHGLELQLCSTLSWEQELCRVCLSNHICHKWTKCETEKHNPGDL